MTLPAIIPEEEWGLLANAVAEPVRGMIAVEAVNSAQMVEAERRLMDLAGTRPVLRQVARPGEEAPETVWQRARQLTTSTQASDTDPLPLLLVKVDAPVPVDSEARQRLAEFWRGMNQLRENWHELPAQIVFLLSPAAYEHLNLNADHLKRWIGLKVRLWLGSTDIVELERPGRLNADGAVMNDSTGVARAPITINVFGQDDQNKAQARQRLTLLAQQFEASTTKTTGVLEQVRRLELLRGYLLPLIEGYIALGELEPARAWRNHVGQDWALEVQDREALAALDERLGVTTWQQTPFDVFLIHNSNDKSAVRELAEALREHGIIVWLGEDELRPGLNRQTQLKNGIKLSSSVAVLIGKDGLGPWEDVEMQVAMMHAVKDSRPVIPVILPDASRQPKLPMFLANRMWVDLRPALNETNLGRLIWGITGKKPNGDQHTVLPVASASLPAEPTAKRTASPQVEKVAGATATTNPYDPWNPATPPRFFGRDKLLRRLGDALDQGRSVSLVGDARIGKSSLLQTWAERARGCGRATRLLSGEGPEGVSCADFVAAVTGTTFTDPSPDMAADWIVQWASDISPDLAPLILVDEAERMLEHLPHRFFERLRGMLGRVCLVLASRRELGEIPRDDRLTSPLLNRLELQRVGLLEDEGVNGIIGLSAGVLTPEDNDLMRKWAGRHPFYLTLLGHCLWDARRHGEGIDEALEEFQENAFPRLNEAWQTLTKREQRLLSDAVLSDIPESDTALKRRGLLDDGYAFGQVLTEWLERPQ